MKRATFNVLFYIKRTKKLKDGTAPVYAILHISGIDAFNNTPIIDIKPFLPSVDYVKSTKNKSAEAFLGHHDEIFIDEIMVKEFVEGKKTEPEE